MVVLGVDRSHFQSPPDYAAMAKAGIGFVIAKVTEGTTYVDPTFPAARAGARGAGQIPGGYHFARWGDVNAEAKFFLATMRPAAGELVALDAEAALPAGVDPVAWSLAWCTAVHAAVDAWPLVYMNQTWLAGHDWSPVAASCGLWLAKYDGAPTGGPTGKFPVMALKQFTDTATVTGQAGPIDEDAFQGTLDQLRKYTVPASAPAPATAGVQGEIAVKYNQTPGLADILGAPVTPELGCPDGKGRFNHFANDGSIYWRADIGAFSVHGGIRDLWAAMGWEKGALGYPQSDEVEVDGWDRTGAPVTFRASFFEHGAITWTVAQGAYAHVTA